MFFFKFRNKRLASIPQEEHYTIFHDGACMGPFSQKAIFALLDNGQIELNAMIKDDEVWRPLSELDWVRAVYEVDENDAEAASAGQDAAETPESGAPPTGKSVTCPHCWHMFRMSQMLFISRHIKLVGDPVLGPDAQIRFLPTVYDEKGYAFDAEGLVCQDMACPRCHLKIPEALIDDSSSLFSIVGAPASGKSYYLTAMIWQMRHVLAQYFDYSLSDTDASFNSVLNHYEQLLFLNREPDQYVALPKTELQGSGFSSQISLSGMSVDLPLPFIFSLTPLRAQTADGAKREVRNLILYDNAGEHFEPGRDLSTSMATWHLIYSDSIVFLYDPLKDSRMIHRCDKRDPQVSFIKRGANQLVLLNEMIGRIKKYSGLRTHEKYDRPLIVVVPKYDTWKTDFPLDLESIEVLHYRPAEMSYFLDVGAVINVSYVVRDMLLELSPEAVSTCESFFSHVYYVPVSALGTMPEYDSEKDMIAIKPGNIHPIWAHVPMLLQLWFCGIIQAVLPSAIEKGIPIETYKAVEDQLLYVLPGQSKRHTAPRLYWGHTVFSTELQDYITFPLPSGPKPDVMAPNTAVSSAVDDEFWTSQE